MRYLKRPEYKSPLDCSIIYDHEKDSFRVGAGLYVRREVAASEKYWRDVIIRQRPDYEKLLDEAADRIMEMKFLAQQSSFNGASPNKIEVVSTGSGEVSIFEDTINGMRIRYCSTGLIISPANPPDWVKEHVDGVVNPMEWYDGFRRTRHEQMNIESYNEKDLV